MKSSFFSCSNMCGVATIKTIFEATERLAEIGRFGSVTIFVLFLFQFDGFEPPALCFSFIRFRYTNWKTRDELGKCGKTQLLPFTLQSKLRNGDAGVLPVNSISGMLHTLGFVWCTIRRKSIRCHWNTCSVSNI